MHDSKLLQLVRTLEKTDFNGFQQFLESPYFFKGKRDEEIIQLFNYIKSFAPTFDQEALTKKNTYHALYPNQTPLKGKIDRLMTRLLKALQMFLAFEYYDLKNDKVKQAVSMSHVYRERHLDKWFYRNIESLRKLQNEVPQKNKTYFYNQFLIEEELTDWESFYNTRKEDLNLNATIQSLDVYYLVVKMEYACRLLAQNKYHQPLHLKNSLNFLDQIRPLYLQEHCANVPILNLYYQALHLLLGVDTEKVFIRLSKDLEVEETNIPLAQLKNLQAIIRSYCIRQYNQGHDKYLHETFKYYRLHLERGYLLYENGLVAGTFRNIVSISLKLKKFDWAMDFINQYKDKIVGTKHPTEVYYFNLADYYFACEDYEKALEYLVDDYEDMYYKIAAKRMELKIYYEQESKLFEIGQESVLLNSRMNAFKIYIFRISKTLLPELKREGNNNFIDFLKRIFSPRTHKDKDRASKLIRKLEECKVVVEKEWLQNKLKSILEQFE